MAKKIRPREDLENPDDLAFQRREWTFQRIGWALMGTVVLAALLGLLGYGPLSDASATDRGGALRVEYQRFLHYHAPDELRIHVQGNVAEKTELRIWLDRQYLTGIELQRVTPEPERVEAASDCNVFVFRIVDPQQPTLVTFHFEPTRVCSLTCRLGAGEREPATFRQFVYP